MPLQVGGGFHGESEPKDEAAKIVSDTILGIRGEPKAEESELNEHRLERKLEESEPRVGAKEED